MKYIMGVVVLLSAVSVSLPCPGTAYAQNRSFEQDLAAVVAKGIGRPLAAAIPSRPSQPCTDAADQSASLTGVAERWGLKVFEQDGVYVLASPFSFDISHASGAAASARMQDPDAMAQCLLASLDAAQMVALGSPVGLRYDHLRPEQQQALAALFSKDNSIVGPEFGFGQPEDADHGPQPLPAGNVRLDGITLSGCLYASDAAIHCASGSCISVDLAQHRESDLNLLSLVWNGSDLQDSDAATEFETENALKPSELDYNRAELAVPVSFNGRVTLDKLIKEIAAKTGLKLTAPAGSEKVPLVVYAANYPAGRILRAVSLATEGAWRQIGSLYLFVVDAEGVGRIAAHQNVRYAKWNKIEADNAMLLASRQWVEAISRSVPCDPTDSLRLSNEQIEHILQCQDVSTDFTFLWSQLSPDEQSLLMDEARNQSMDEAEAPEDPLSQIPQSVDISLELELTANVPGVGRIRLNDSGMTFPEDDNEPIDFLAREAPKGVKVELKSPVRGLLLAPSRSDKPEYVIGMMKRHRLNTLFLRVFFNGYTVFPSEQFPTYPRYQDYDYLRKMIEQAHAGGVKVIAVVDVLRWSDGSKSHWLRKNPQIIDRDLIGRTTSELDTNSTVPAFIAALLPYAFGDAMKGDAVTPFQPAVSEKIKSLLTELSAYPVDGVALDYTMIKISGEMELDPEGTGGTGYADAARAAFVSRYGVDPVDIPLNDESIAVTALSEGEPLSPLLESAHRMEGEWSKFYLKACDNLLDQLVTEWRDLKKESPVWVVDSFGSANSGCHDWSRFAGRIDGALNILAMDSPDYPGHRLKRMALVRPSETAGSLFFASMLALLQGQTFDGLDKQDLAIDPSAAKDGIVFDFTNAGRRKNEFLTMIR